MSLMADNPRVLLAQAVGKVDRMLGRGVTFAHYYSFPSLSACIGLCKKHYY